MLTLCRMLTFTYPLSTELKSTHRAEFVQARLPQARHEGAELSASAGDPGTQSTHTLLKHTHTQSKRERAEEWDGKQRHN